ncbi:MAG: translocation/assembly module TamB domain-containing protein, partial [Gemmatimonadaceae bacterium]
KDLGVIVTLRGRLAPYPGIGLSSNSDYDIAPSDLVSYLLTGRPGFDYGANPGASQVLTSFLGPTLSAAAADRLRQYLGSAIDLQFQLGTSSATGANGLSNTNSFRSSLYNSTVGAGRQFGNVYLNVNSSFCGLNPNASGYNARDMLGAEASYHFNSKLSTKIAYDPGTAGRACTVTQDFANFIRTPGQFSFSLTHLFRF